MFTSKRKDVRLQHWDGPARSQSGEALSLPRMEPRDLRRRLAIGAATAIALTLTMVWLAPPIPQREGQICQRDFRVRVAFSVITQGRSQDDAKSHPVVEEFPVGTTIVRRGEALRESHLTLLRHEHQAYLTSLGPISHLGHFLARFTMILLMCVLVGLYIARFQPTLAQHLPHLAGVGVQTVLTCGLALALSHSPWHAAAVPLLVAAMAFALTFNPQFALLMSFGLSLMTVLSQGGSVEQLLILLSGPTTAVLLLVNVRTRARLIQVSAAAGLAYVFAVIAVGLHSDQPARWVAIEAGRHFVWALLAGFILSGSLPLLERCFGIVTDVTLLELADSSHPLLQELIRRAPGTYTHSMSVAALAESAAEAIGVNPLLTRVGCYYHDVGKMLKPQYFIENQLGSNRHDQLEPTMSTLVILNHVKDGVALARAYRLPPRVIDFIQQHHGTTLIEYFYREALRIQGNDSSSSDLEFAFRYSGPKPQSREVAILMLADAVESASRALTAPTSSSLRKLVHELTLKRLLDGQFDDSGLTLTEVRKIEESLCKGVTAVFHSRIKYPADIVKKSAG